MAILVLGVFLAKKQRLISFCIFWYFGNQVIESSIIGLELVFELAIDLVVRILARGSCSINLSGSFSRSKYSCNDRAQVYHHDIRRHILWQKL